MKKTTTLLFSLLPLLGACTAPRQVSRTEEASLNGAMQARLDSIVRTQIAVELERLSVSEGESVTSLIVFDTDKPPADSTGLPPVRAVLRSQTQHTRHSRETAAATGETDSQTLAENTANTSATVHSVKVERQRPQTGSGVLRLGIGTLLLTVVAFAIRILWKRKRY